MALEIVEPTKGFVALTLPWDEAEIFLRIVGMTNTGDLNAFAPSLAKHVEEMVRVFGRNTDLEARKYQARVANGQVYVERHREDEL